MKIYYLEVVNRQTGKRHPCGDIHGYRPKEVAIKAAKVLYKRGKLAETDGNYIRVLEHVGSVEMLARILHTMWTENE